MNGNSDLLDTNAIVQLLKGNKELIAVLGAADFIATSIVAEMEYLSFSGLSDADVAKSVMADAFLCCRCRHLNQPRHFSPPPCATRHNKV